jgi:hypothetical protein
MDHVAPCRGYAGGLERRASQGRWRGRPRVYAWALLQGLGSAKKARTDPSPPKGGAPGNGHGPDAATYPPKEPSHRRVLAPEPALKGLEPAQMDDAAPPVAPIPLDVPGIATAVLEQPGASGFQTLVADRDKPWRVFRLESLMAPEQFRALFLSGGGFRPVGWHDRHWRPWIIAMSRRSTGGIGTARLSGP